MLLLLQSISFPVWWFPKKTKHRIVIWFSNSTSGYITKRIERKDLNRYLNISIHNSIIHKSQKVEKNPMSISGWMDKQDVLYTCDGILFNHKKGWNSDICYNMDETETFVWHKRPNIEVFWIEKYIELESRMLVTKDWGKEGIRSYCLVSTEFLFEMIKQF